MREREKEVGRANPPSPWGWGLSRGNWITKLNPPISGRLDYRHSRFTGSLKQLFFVTACSSSHICTSNPIDVTVIFFFAMYNFNMIIVYNVVLFICLTGEPHIWQPCSSKVPSKERIEWTYHHSFPSLTFKWRPSSPQGVK